jgi:hypothetical protein
MFSTAYPTKLVCFTLQNIYYYLFKYARVFYYDKYLLLPIYNKLVCFTIENIHNYLFQ